MSIRDYSECSYSVVGWMTSGLKLKNLEKDVYAIIYGFSQSENSGGFWGSAEYIVGLTGVHRDTVYRALGSLMDKGYIKRQEIGTDYGKRQIYTIIQEVVTAAKKVVQQPTKSLSDTTIDRTPYDNKSYNNRQKVVSDTTIDRTPYDNKSYNNRQKVVSDTTIDRTPYDNKSYNLKDNLKDNLKQKEKEEAAAPRVEDYATKILAACQYLGVHAGSLEQLAPYKSQANRDSLAINIANTKFDIAMCIDLALAKTKELIKQGVNISPLFKFADLVNTNLTVGCKELYTALNIAQRQAADDERSQRQAAADVNHAKQKQSDEQQYNNLAATHNITIDDIYSYESLLFDTAKLKIVMGDDFDFKLDDNIDYFVELDRFLDLIIATENKIIKEQQALPPYAVTI